MVIVFMVIGVMLWSLVLCYGHCCYVKKNMFVVLWSLLCYGQYCYGHCCYERNNDNNDHKNKFSS